MALWEVYGRYEVRAVNSSEAKDFMAIAKPYRHAELSNERVGFLQRLDHRHENFPKDWWREVGLDYQEWKAQNPVSRPVRRVYEDQSYAPLENCPGLFLKFSHLADTGGVSQKRWLEWIDTYGVLGLMPRGASTGKMPIKGDKLRDLYSVFVEEAQLASWCRRLFEAATTKRKPDINTLRELLPDDYGTDGNEEADALQIVMEVIDKKVREGCFRQRLVRGNYRQSRSSPLLSRWNFNSLIGAMWLQFQWLTQTDDWMRRCEYCGGMLAPNSRSDKKWCDREEGKACRQAIHRRSKVNND